MVDHSTREDKLKKVMEALKLLNEKVRKVVECRFLYSMTRKETADLLSMKEEDVHKYQQRGVKYLKEKIASK